MLYVFTGADSVATRAKAHEFLELFEERGIRAAHIDADACTDDMLRDRIGARSLFGDSQNVEVTILDMPSENGSAFESILAFAPALADSENVFVVLEHKLLAAPAKVLKEYATNYVEVKGGAAEERFNVFVLSDAFARRDKKSLWVLLMQAMSAGLSPEEISGTLLWQIKNMRLALHTKTAEEAGVKPFVYSKAKRAAEKFKERELDALSRSLLTLYHEARLGNVDMDSALERWVLTI